MEIGANLAQTLQTLFAAIDVVGATYFMLRGE